MTEEISFPELVEAIVNGAVDDISRHASFCNPKSIANLIATSKKSPSCPMSPVEKWHPSEVANAYEFLFEGLSVTRTFKGQEITYSLEDLISWLPGDINFKNFQNQLRNKLSSKLGYSSHPVAGISFEIVSKDGEVDMKKVSEELVSRLVKLTRQCVLQWDLDEENKKGCVPGYIDDPKKNMKHAATYVAVLEDEVLGTLVLSLSCYEKEAKAKGAAPPRKYREYIMSAQLVKDGGYGSDLEIKGMGKLWRMIGGDKHSTDSKLNVKSLNNFLGNFGSGQDDPQ